MRDGLFRASFIDARTRPIPVLDADHEENSPDCFNVRENGRIENKLVTLTAAGNPVEVNLFEVTGLVRLNQIVGIFEDVTNVVDIDDVRLDVTDGVHDTVITSAAGVVCDAATVNASLVKIDDATGALVFLNADEARIEETNKHSNLDPVMINAENGGTSYVRMLYKNVDTNLNCKIRWYAEWRSYHGDTGLLVPV